MAGPGMTSAKGKPARRSVPLEFLKLRFQVSGFRFPDHVSGFRMKILLTASEVAPFSSAGGLGDVLESLPPALAARGHEVSVAMPCHRGLRDDPRLGAKSTGVRIPVQVGAKRLVTEILEGRAPNGTQIFLIRCDEFFDREERQDGADDAERFIFFSRALVELARRILPPPDIVHVHDWQTALVPVLVKHARLPFRTVLTIHDVARQGSFWGVDFALTNLPGEYFSARGVEFHGSMNLLKGGILHADALTAVGESCAREMQTPEFGHGLDAVLREHAHKLRGVLTGADYARWNPAADPFLPKTYKPSQLAGKMRCRGALLGELGLVASPIGPVFAARSGSDLLLPLLDRLLSHDVRMAIVGEARREFMIASRRYPERFAFRESADERLSHLLEAGADISFEPRGIPAMHSLKYGTLPIARARPGLDQILQDYDPATGAGTSFLFFQDTPEALWDTIVRAQRDFADAPLWKGIVRRAMAADFSWAKAVVGYEEIYSRVLRG